MVNGASSTQTKMPRKEEDTWENRGLEGSHIY